MTAIPPEVMIGRSLKRIWPDDVATDIGDK
jgi:hypothetical protein